MAWRGVKWDFLGSRAQGKRASLVQLLVAVRGSRDLGPMWFVVALLVFSLAYAGGAPSVPSGRQGQHSAYRSSSRWCPRSRSSTSGEVPRCNGQVRPLPTQVLHPLVPIGLSVAVRGVPWAPEVKFLVVAPAGIPASFAVGYTP